MTKQLTGWDFTLRHEKSDKTFYTKDDVIRMLAPICSKYVFQLEKGEETGYEHYQGRMRLIKKQIKSTLLKNFKDVSLSDLPSFSPTSDEVFQTSNFNYVLKADTRLEGPWSDRDTIREELKEPIYVPKQYRIEHDKLYPWQKFIVDNCCQYDTRTINILYDPNGNIGKSTLSGYLYCKKDAVIVPDIDDSSRIVYSVCDILRAKKIRHTIPIFLDLPRSIDPNQLGHFYRSIERIKSGIIYDTRNRFQAWEFDSPCIWVFTNKIPDSTALSLDRWKIWQINEYTKELIPYISARFNTELKLRRKIPWNTKRLYIKEDINDNKDEDTIYVLPQV